MTQARSYIRMLETRLERPSLKKNRNKQARKAKDTVTKANQARNYEVENVPDTLLEKIRQLETDNKALRQNLWKYKRKPSGAIGYLLLIAGFSALVWSQMYASQVPAFIGIALIFWGGLFLFIRPSQYMKTGLLSPTALPALTAISGMIEALNYKGKAYFCLLNTLENPEARSYLFPLKTT